MTQPREGTVLRDIARRLAEVFEKAATLVGKAEDETRLRDAETARVAAVLGRVDAASRRRVMSARRAATAAEVQAAQALADEMRYQAGSRALAAVHRYAGTLAAEAEDANLRGREKLAQFGEAISHLDTASARALLEVIEKAEAGRLATAQRQAADLAAQIRAALGALPAPLVDLEVERPRSRKAKRKARQAAQPAEAQDTSAEQADVVVLDPKRRRTAT
jgi:hypothetical protein